MSIMPSVPSWEDRMWDYVPAVPALDIVEILDRVARRLRAQRIWDKLSLSTMCVGETREVSFEEMLVEAAFDFSLEISEENRTFRFEVLPHSINITRTG